MSDNPADSLRRELEAEVLMACDRFVADNLSGTTGWQLKTAEALRDEIQPLVSAALEAARADERERARRQAFTEAADAIEADDGIPKYNYIVRTTLAYTVALVRGLGEGTENA